MPNAYGTYSWPRFDGGLYLSAQPDIPEPSQAIDLLNVTFSERGAVRQRDGYAKLTSSALTNQPDSIFPYYTSAGTTRLVVGNGNRLDVLTSFPGASAANSTAPTASPHFFARYGSPTGERVYIANGTDAIRKLDGTTFTSAACGANEKGKFLAVWENRLVQARLPGVTTGGQNVSSVRFSEPANPEDFTADTWEDLHPGDGEAITGVATWRELLFVFKESKFFVFYGIGLTADGGDDPQWRAVEAGVGAISGRAITATRDGVYFLARDGVYRTTGQEPEQVSDPIDPFFIGDTSPFFGSNALNQGAVTQAAMTFWRERLYLSVPTGGSTTNDRMLVYDPRFKWWSLYDIPASCLCSFSPSPTSDPELVFGYAAGANDVGRHFSGIEADDMTTTQTGGTAITSRFRSAWPDLGNPAVKTVRETELWGEGEVQFKLTRDFLDTGTTTSLRFGPATTDTWGDGTDPGDTWGDGSSSSDLWGPARSITPKLARKGKRGTVFSILLTGSGNAWAIHRAVLHLREQRNPTTTRTEVAA